MYKILLNDSSAILPEIFLVCLGLFLLMAEVFCKGDKGWFLWISFVGMIVAGLLIIPASNISGFIFGNMLSADLYTSFFRVIFLGSAAFVLLLSFDFVKYLKRNTGEYFALIVFATVGMMIMAAATDFVTIYLGLELTSLSSYVLCGFVIKDKKSNESALKYFLLGLLASSIMIFGVTYVYGITGTSNLQEIGKFLLNSDGKWSPLLLTGMTMVLIGFAFKIAAAPFHVWAPDVYEGAPTPVTAFISVGPKVAGVAAMLRILSMAFGPMRLEWSIMLSILAIVSMTLGNLLALRQDKLKRMLAFSGVVHIGYALIGMVAGAFSEKTGFSSVLLYMFFYFIPNIGAFAIIILISDKKMDSTYDDFKGLASKYPWIAFVMTLFMLSLMGMPPASGFIGKFWIFSASVESGIVWLGVIGVINAIIASYYYLRLIVCMYSHEAKEEIIIKSNAQVLKMAIIAMAVITLYLGIFPNPFINLVQRSVAAII